VEQQARSKKSLEVLLKKFFDGSTRSHLLTCSPFSALSHHPEQATIEVRSASYLFSFNIRGSKYEESPLCTSHNKYSL